MRPQCAPRRTGAERRIATTRRRQVHPSQRTARASHLRARRRGGGSDLVYPLPAASRRRRRLTSDDEEVRLRAAKAWATWEMSTSTLLPPSVRARALSLAVGALPAHPLAAAPSSRA